MLQNDSTSPPTITSDPFGSSSSTIVRETSVVPSSVARIRVAIFTVVNVLRQYYSMFLGLRKPFFLFLDVLDARSCLLLALLGHACGFVREKDAGEVVNLMLDYAGVKIGELEGLRAAF